MCHRSAKSGVLSVGSGVRLTNNSNGSVTLYGSSGFSAVFPQFENGYQSPPGLDTRMFLNSDQSHTLAFEKTGECFGFDANGHEIFDEDKNQNVMTFSYDPISSRLTSLIDTQNRVTTFGQINLITDPSGRTIQYHYNPTTHNLTSSVDAAPHPGIPFSEMRYPPRII